MVVFELYNRFSPWNLIGEEVKCKIRKKRAGKSGRSTVEAKAKAEKFPEEVEAGSGCSQRGSSTAWL